MRDLAALFVPFFGLFQIIFPIIFASFVPKRHFYRKTKGSWWFSDNSSEKNCVVCTGPKLVDRIKSFPVFTGNPYICGRLASVWFGVFDKRQKKESYSIYDSSTNSASVACVRAAKTNHNAWFLLSIFPKTNHNEWFLLIVFPKTNHDE